MMFWMGLGVFAIGATMQFFVNGPGSPWFWGPLIPMVLLIGLRLRTRRT